MTPCAGAIRAYGTSARWLVSYRAAAAAKIDFRPQRAPLHSRRQLHVCASAQARGAGRDPSARDECAGRRSYGSAVGLYHTAAVAKIGFRRPLARKRQPPSQTLRLAVTPPAARLVWPRCAIRLANSCIVLRISKMHTRAIRSDTNSYRNSYLPFILE